MLSPCTIPLEALLDLREGRSPSADSAALRAHLASDCARCAERWRWLQQMLPDLPAALTEAAPGQTSLAYVHSLARLLRPEPQPTASEWIRHIARRVLGASHHMAPAPGARGGSSAPVQRLFETESHLITLWDEPDIAPNRYLIGQVYRRAGAAVAPISTTLVLPDASERLAAREGSEFHLAAVPPGVYLITCRLETAEEILVPGVEVGIGDDRA